MFFKNKIVTSYTNSENQRMSTYIGKLDGTDLVMTQVLHPAFKVTAVDEIGNRSERYHSALGREILEKVFNGKPSIIMDASMGILCSVIAQMHLRDIQMADSLNSPMVRANEVYVGAVHEKFDADGNLTDEPIRGVLKQKIYNFHLL